MMTPAERERAAAYLAETRENLLRAASSFSPAQLQYKPAPDRWSVAECLEHIIFVEGFILAKINDTLQDKPATSTSAMSDDDMVQTIVSRTPRLNGPDHVMPTGRWAHDQLLGEFESARKRTSEFAASTNAPLRQHGFPHPVFGHFDCYQWLLLIAAHGERHRAQAEEVLAEPGFPRAAAASSSRPPPLAPRPASVECEGLPSLCSDEACLARLLAWVTTPRVPASAQKKLSRHPPTCPFVQLCCPSTACP